MIDRTTDHHIIGGYGRLGRHGVPYIDGSGMNDDDLVAPQEAVAD